MKSLTVNEFTKILDGDEDIQIIDVREDYEKDDDNNALEGLKVDQIINIPLFDIKTSMDKVSKEKRVIIICRSGHRSLAVVDFLSNEGYDNVFNLHEGLKDIPSK